jgi:hypothetical protein
VKCGKRKCGWRSAAADGFVCRACYRAHFAPREPCGCCKRPNQIINARPDGVPYCEGCYKREINRGPCAYCDRRRPVHARDGNNRPVCLECYEKNFKATERCMHCGNDRPPAYRGPRGQGICRACYHNHVNHAPCDACGHDLPIATRTRSGKPLCTHHCHLAHSSPSRSARAVVSNVMPSSRRT